MSVEFCEENSDRSKKMHYFRENWGGGGGGPLRQGFIQPLLLIC